MIGLILDTNVLVSANLNSDGLEALVVSLGLNRKVQLYVSEPILAEYEQVLIYPRLKFSLQEVGRFMALIRRASVLVRPARLVSESTHDTDNRFLECAEAAGADFLVTGNRRHFPKRWKKTQVVNARELLGMVGPSFLE
ncbi:MAG: putative toxin-antitoxin system toxin component, PIN family [Bryobacteraceae bacterium]|jgi:putative PIN family toxin of toxin-antitoxin system